VLSSLYPLADALIPPYTGVKIKAMSDTEFPLPPATFEFLTASLKMQAEVQLGLIHFGEEKDRPAPNFPLARHSIDMLAMLLEKTKGNLTTEEQRFIENSVTELRFRFIQLLEQSGKRAQAGSPEQRSTEQPKIDEDPEEGQAEEGQPEPGQPKTEEQAPS
jgi:hypothetical protein